MTGPLHEILKEGDTVKITVDSGSHEIYSPPFLHSQIGKIWQLDEEHIWIMSYVRNTEGKVYESGPHRYCWYDITLERAVGIA